MKAHEWVEKNYKLSLSEFQRKAVDLLCASQGRGPYDLECWKNAKWNYANEVRFVLRYPRLSSFDSPGLTTLVIGAHEEMIRVAIDPVNFTHLAISMWQRGSREGETPRRHPTIEAAIDTYRGVRK